MKQMLSGGRGKAALKEEVAHAIAETNEDYKDDHLAKFHNYTGWTGSLRPAKLGPLREVVHLLLLLYTSFTIPFCSYLSLSLDQIMLVMVYPIVR